MNDSAAKRLHRPPGTKLTRGQKLLAVLTGLLTLFAGVAITLAVQPRNGTGPETKNDGIVPNVSPGASAPEPLTIDSNPASFPGAEGFGATTAGGRGGRVIEVTSLADSGHGTLRKALESRGPRIIVFRTGGTITLRSEIDVRNPFVTVAGQTAPGDGITLKASRSNADGLIDLHTHDVIIRFIRFREGAHDEVQAAIALAIAESSRVVIDHCSLSWATDEVLTTWDDTKDITLSWNIISEGLSESSHYEGEHSRGLLISGDNSRNVSVHHNLMAHNMRRNPEVSTAGTADIRNNVVYNWGTHATVVTDKRGMHGVNVVGNYFKPGPSTTDDDRYEVDAHRRGDSGIALYAHGNIGPHRSRDDRPDGESVSPQQRQWLISEPILAPPVTTTSAVDAYRQVLAAAGARVPKLDLVDKRIIRDVKEGTGRIIDDPKDVGGWPDLQAGTAPIDTDHDGMPDSWEKAHGSNPAADDSAVTNGGTGYTKVEDYLNGLIAPHLYPPGVSY